MKVAMIGLRGLGDGLGGVEKVVRESSVRLVKRGVDVTCYCRPRYNTETEFEGVKLVNTATIYSKHLETALYAVGSAWRVTWEDYDLIHVHAMASSLLGWMPRWLGRKPMVITVHGLDWQRAKWGPIARQLLRLGEWSAVRFADCTTCVSLSLQVYFQMRYIRDRFAYIPNGCDWPETTPPPPEEWPSRGYVLYMGRLVPEKGVHRLIEAYRSMKTEMPLVIAGPESHAPEYGRKLRELAAGDPRIQLIGSITGDRKESILSHAYLFVLPSEIEGLPVALLEAASRGVCPAVSSIPTSIEVLGDMNLARGFTFDPRRVDQLRSVLEISIENPDLVAALGAQAQSYVRSRYNWDAIADQLHEVYKDVLASRTNDKGGAQ